MFFFFKKLLGGKGIGVDNLLLEDGTNFLLDDGGVLIL